MAASQAPENGEIALACPVEKGIIKADLRRKRGEGATLREKLG